MGAHVRGSNLTFDTLSEQRCNAQAWIKNPVNACGFLDGPRSGSGTLNSDFFDYIDDFIQFPISPATERPELSYSFDTAFCSQYPIDPSYSQNSFGSSSEPVDFTLGIKSSGSRLLDDDPDAVTLASPTNPASPLQEEAADPAKKSNDIVPSSKRRGRKPKGPFTAAEKAVRREKFLERNRSAATRCRHRKKQEIEELKERQIDLQRRNRQLVIEASELESELEKLNNMVMSCAGCLRRRSSAFDHLRDSQTALDAKSGPSLPDAVLPELEGRSGDNTSRVHEARRSLSSYSGEGGSEASSPSRYPGADMLDGY